jgi:hypothetical protein
MVVVFGVMLAGCATESGYYDPYRSAGAGALGGAATGAAIGSIIGAATGSAATGAWVGAAAGGALGLVAGALYAQHRNSEIRSAQAAQAAYNYNPAQGNVVNIEQASASPTQVAPGQPVNLGMTYTVLNPGNAPTSVTIVREMYYGTSLLGQPYQTTVTNTNGTYNDAVAYNLPGNANPGNYRVVNRVMSGGGQAQRDVYFTVR